MARKTNFGGLPPEYSSKDAGTVILPVPYDGTSTWVKGADKGPDAILEASANMELYDIDTDSEPFERGIFTDVSVAEKKSPERMVEAVRARVAGHLKNGKFVVLLGGEHSVSIGAIKAHAEKFRDFCVLQLDAHADLRQEYEGSKCSHACVMARARELCPIVQVGIRSMSVEEKEGLERGRIFFAKDMQARDNWMDAAISKLSKNVYITIDLDVFDPAIVPSTGTPEPGGLGWYEVLEFLKKVIKSRSIVGFDVVELCPNKGAKASDFLAAKLVYQLLAFKASSKSFYKSF